MNISFDNQKYIELQSKHIKDRIDKFGGKLYLEFGGKLFDDYHASRVLPGFKPDSKLQMLLQLKEKAEKITGVPNKLPKGDRMVAEVISRYGDPLDKIYNVPV